MLADSIRASAPLLALLAAAAPVAAQSPLRSPHLSLYPETNFYDFKVADLGDDAVPDLVFTTIVDSVREADGDGVGGILPTTNVVDADSLALAIGDLTGDGRDDCAFLPLSGAQVLVRLNLGGGAWGPGPALATYGKPSAVAIADLDLDGQLDVLAAIHGLERLQWFRNLGGASFAAAVDVECAEDALALAVGDVDGNGWPDIASASDVIGSASIAATRADGAGGFLPADSLASGIVLQPGDTLLVADVNGDALGDVLLAQGALGVAVFHGDAGKQPRPPVYVATLLPCQSLGAGDLDDDGDTDLSAGQHGGLVTNFLQDGGGLVAPRQFAAAVGPVFEQVTDLDLDGHLDVITGNGQVLTPLMGRGLGDFRPCYGFASLPLDLAMADHDADGFPDAVVVLADGSASLLPGVPGGSLGRDQAVDLGPAPFRVFFGAANGDARPDLLALESGAGADGLAIALADGLGGFHPPTLASIAPSVKGGTAGDLNLDHLVDIVVLRSLANDHAAIVFMAQGGGVYAMSATLQLAVRPIDAEIADMNEDALPDLVLLQDGQLTVFPGTGNGTFGTGLTAASVPNAVDLLVRDFDGDGHLDAVVARQSDAEVRIHFGNGDGTLQAPVTENVRVKPTGLAGGDFDGDGGLDLLVTGLVDVTLPGSVAVLPSVHGGGFGDVTVAASSSNSGKPVAIDLDDDGRLDAALLVPLGNQLDLYLNAAGTWAPLGHSLAGAAGYSRLLGVGPLAPGSGLSVLVDGATPLVPAILVAGFDTIFAPFKGGVLVPAPGVLVAGLATGAVGELSLAGTWPAGVPSGTTLVLQAWFVDAGGPQGLSATTAVRGSTP